MRGSISIGRRTRSETLRIISCLAKDDKKISFAEYITDLLHEINLADKGGINQDAASFAFRTALNPSLLPINALLRRRRRKNFIIFFFLLLDNMTQSLPSCWPTTPLKTSYCVDISSSCCRATGPLEQVRQTKCVVSLQANGTKLAAVLIWLRAAAGSASHAGNVRRWLIVI